ncbi:MAG TPA: OmpA family protein [Dissulfurispiraceae bacterium]|nr:OmpA family protein [Dissulfurispiraceae bacterium]
MQAITAKRVLLLVIVVFSLSVMVGCSGMEKRPAYRSGYLYYPSELVKADQALDEARAGGKDKECPAEFNAAKDMVDKAYEVYMACNTQLAKDTAKEALDKIKALCPPKPVAKPTPEPAPAPKPRVIDRLTIHVNFDFDKANIRKGDEAELKKAVDFVKKYRGARVELDGHTDGKGTEQYNQKLSEKRAEAVRQYLIKAGASDKARISAKGYGMTRPIAPNTTKDGKDNPEGRAENRRVEVIILSE